MKKLVCLLTLFVLSLEIYSQSSVFKNKTFYEYQAVYTDSVNQIYTVDTIKLKITDLPWKNQPAKQKTMVWEYRSDYDSLFKSQFYNIGWHKTDSTGYIENEAKLFIHPPRHNQYAYTEIAPFPQILFPLELNNSFKRILYIGSGWAQWENLKLVNEYAIESKASLELFGQNLDCWFVHATSTSELGISSLDFIFNTEFGFIEMNYHFYDNKSMVFKLITYK